MDDAVLTDAELKNATIKVVSQGSFTATGKAPGSSKGTPKTATVNGEEHIVSVYTDAHGRVTVYVETEEVRVALEKWRDSLA